MTTDRPVFSVCSGVLAASLLLVLSPSAYADDMGGLWPVKDSAVVVRCRVPLPPQQSGSVPLPPARV